MDYHLKKRNYCLTINYFYELYYKKAITFSKQLQGIEQGPEKDDKVRQSFLKTFLIALNVSSATAD
jgi:hypothetical protein